MRTTRTPPTTDRDVRTAITPTDWQDLEHPVLVDVDGRYLVDINLSTLQIII